MIRYLLDTDHLSLSERGDARVQRRLLVFGPDQVAISVVSAEEMIRGRLAVLARHSEGERRVQAHRKFLATFRFLHGVQILDFDLDCEKTFTELRRQKIRIGSQDLRIAATALVHECTLVTRNRTDFARVPALRLEDWSVSA
ncbi:MAG: type II toxin-antitoxin system VapC family toxin [Deltaproteobacteria bacterium]|nr:type II toxin-antitoxin system VapC family toxin [Deltaproteobacteria bacterium]